MSKLHFLNMRKFKGSLKIIEAAENAELLHDTKGAVKEEKCHLRH